MPRGEANKRLFQAGKQSRFKDERLAEDRRAWLKTFIGQFILRIQPKDEDDKESYGDSVILVIPRPSGRPVFLNLTNLTSQELSLMKQFFDTVFDLAEPLCAERDRIAQNAFDNGDDSHIRLYRSVPDLIVREGTIGKHGEVLRDRLANVSTGRERHVNPSIGFRGVRDEVVAEQPPEQESEDDGSQDHKS
jgi:hypothetical protein